MTKYEHDNAAQLLGPTPPMLPDSIKKLPGVQSALLTATWAQRRYFDWRHNVRTTGDMGLAEMDAVSRDTSLSGEYHPIHPRAAGRILSQLPAIDHSKYTFIDLGSGKGLMLLMAAEYPYAEIHGVEFSRKLHDVAERNIANYRNPRQRCFNLKSFNVDAKDYAFPRTPLVVYIFNSFRHELLRQVLQNLDRSLEEVPRDVLIVYMHPLDAYLFDTMKHVRPLPVHPVADSKVYRSVR